MQHTSLTLYSCLSSLVPFLPPHSDWQCTRVSSSGSTSVTKLALKNRHLCPVAGDKESGRIAWRAIDGNIPMTFGGVLLQNKGWVRIKVFPGRVWKKHRKEVGLGVALFSDRGVVRLVPPFFGNARHLGLSVSRLRRTFRLTKRFLCNTFSYYWINTIGHTIYLYDFVF